jgi:hypothetical protein
MLLDIENYYGEHEGRLAPLLIFLALVAAPPLVWIYLGFPIPLVIFVPIWIVYGVRVTLLTLGREKERLKHFRDALNDKYQATADLLDIAEIHNDGLIEYHGNKVAYAFVIAVGTVINSVQQTRHVDEYLSPILSGEYDFDLLILNVTDTSVLEDRYNTVKFFSNQNAAQDFVDIVDYNRNYIKEHSLLNKIVIVLKGRKDEWKSMCLLLTAMPTGVFKDAHIAPRNEVLEILGRDFNGTFNFADTLQKKYTTSEYYGSKVLGYDTDISQVVQSDDHTEPATALDFLQR